MTRMCLTLVLVLLLVACGKTELTKLDENSVVLAFGDSLTAGLGVNKSDAYPAELAQMLGVTVINAGVSGETTVQGLKRLPIELETHTPDLVILFEGGNDILRNMDLTLTKQNLNAMIDLIEQAGAEVVLVAVPRKALFSSAAKLYPELAKEHDIPLQKDIVATLLKQPAMKSDSVHFNEAGYRAIAEAVKKLLEKHGAA